MFILYCLPLASDALRSHCSFLMTVLFMLNRVYVPVGTYRLIPRYLHPLSASHPLPRPLDTLHRNAVAKYCDDQHARKHLIGRCCSHKVRRLKRKSKGNPERQYRYCDSQQTKRRCALKKWHLSGSQHKDDHNLGDQTAYEPVGLSQRDKRVVCLTNVVMELVQAEYSHVGGGA